MATYDHEKVLADYGHGKIDVEMAMGHALQHIGHLYAAQNADRQALRKRVDALEAAIAHLQKMQTERLHLLETGLTTLQQTVDHWRADLTTLVKQ